MGTHHYLKDLNNLVSKMQKRKLRSRNMMCRKCFHRFSSEERLERHQLICMGNEPAIVTMVIDDKSSVGFKNIGARRYSPFAVFFDLDSVLEKVETVRNNPTCSRTTVIEKHKPSSFFLVVVEAGNPKPVFFFHFIEWWTRWLNSFECWKYRRVTFVIKYDDTRTTSEAPLFLKTVTNSGFAKRNSPKLTRKYWTIIISMDHSSDGLTTDATSNSFVVKVKAWYILKTPSSVFLYNFSVT